MGKRGVLCPLQERNLLNLWGLVSRPQSDRGGSGFCDEIAIQRLENEVPHYGQFHVGRIE